MKTTVTTNRSTTTKKWSKTLTGEGGRRRIATIEAEQDDRHGNDTTRRIRICTDTEGYAINTRDRKNENGGSPTELEAMNQLNQAREELQEEAEDRARGQRVAEWQPDGSQRRNEQGEVATEEAAETRIENAKRDIITQLR
jgi:hypothetical protein